MNIDEMPAGIELDILVAEALGYVRTPIIIEAERIATKTEDPIFIVVRGGFPGLARIEFMSDRLSVVVSLHALLLALTLPLPGRW